MRPRLDNSLVLSFKQDRIADATIDALFDLGYEGANLADLVSRAGVARKTFYDIFPMGKKQAVQASLKFALRRFKRDIDDLSKLDGAGERKEVVVLIREAPRLNHDVYLEMLDYIASLANLDGSRGLGFAGGVVHLMKMKPGEDPVAPLAKML